ncbi:4542_t:CDS:2 [Dentiscutata erythropus]|uniref:4542_t:CDS:1 n=1 Tax=Dentiscutata erythropus TaxID=1348616 RepID=A0A9N9EVZ7_9GLOM|nr:4542_t:CDS:2 [Dentiscutata erythropus]
MNESKIQKRYIKKMNESIKQFVDSKRDKFLNELLQNYKEVESQKYDELVMLLQGIEDLEQTPLIENSDQRPFIEDSKQFLLDEDLEQNQPVDILSPSVNNSVDLQRDKLLDQKSNKFQIKVEDTYQHQYWLQRIRRTMSQFI